MEKVEKATAIGEIIGAKFRVFWDYTERFVRAWEQRPLIRRKREVLTGAVCIGLCLIGKFTYEVQDIRAIHMPALNSPKAREHPFFSKSPVTRISGDSLARQMYRQSLNQRKHSKTKTEPTRSH